MAETTTAAAEQPKKIVSAGKPVAADSSPSPSVSPVGTETQITNTQNAAQTPAVTEKVVDKNAATETVNPDDQLKAILKERGIDFSGNIEELKQKLGAPAQTAAPTAEEQKQIEKDNEKRLLDLHLSKGHTPEEFVHIKSIMNGDPKGLARQAAKKELTDEGYTEEEANALVKKIHFEVSDEDLSMMDDDEKAKIEKERAYGLKKLEKSGSIIIESAKSYWEDLASEVKASDEAKVKMEQYLSKVEDTVKKMPRKQTIDLGEYEGQKLGSVDYDVPDETLTEVKTLLTPESIKKNFLTADGTFNTEFLVKHLTNSLSFEKAIKHGYLSGQTNAIKTVRGTFGNRPPELGGHQRTEKGKIVSAGEPSVVQNRK